MYLFIYLIFGCVGSSLLRVGFLLLVASGGYSSLRCVGFSLRWLLLLRSPGFRCTGFSSCGTRALEHRLSSCGARAQLLRGMWDLPRPGIEPVSPALAGGFLTIAPPGKPTCVLLKFYQLLRSRDLICFLYTGLTFPLGRVPRAHNTFRGPQKCFHFNFF